MPIKVSGYYREVNGRRFFVRGYVQNNREQQVAHGFFSRPAVTAKEGNYTHGLVPRALFPAGRETPNLPTLVWIKHLSQFDTSAIRMVKFSDPLVALAGATQEWEDAIEPGLKHLLLVVGNNKNRELEDILKRPDVQQALKSAGRAGAKSAKAAIVDSWEGAGAPKGSGYLKSILADLDRNGKTFAKRMTESLTTNNLDKVKSTFLRDRYRAAAAQAVADTRAKNEAAIARFIQADVRYVQWRAKDDPTTCNFCKTLHGDIVKIGREFDAAKVTPIKVYYNLVCPPLHPNCRCSLFPVDQKGKEIKL